MPSSRHPPRFALALTVILRLSCGCLVVILQLSCGYLRRLYPSHHSSVVLRVVLPRTSRRLAITIDLLFYPPFTVLSAFLHNLPRVLRRSRGFSASPLSRPLSTPVTITEDRPQPVTWNSSTVVCLLSHFFPFVMDMVIFRTIFFELFSFLHIHALYPPFRLLTNLGTYPGRRQNTVYERPIVMVQNHELVLLLL